MFFSLFKSTNTQGVLSKAVTLNSATLNQLHDWHAYRIFVTEPTIINGFYLRTTGNITGTNTLTVGISTSLGPNGIFPYVSSTEFMNTNVGTAKTIAFSYSQSISLAPSTGVRNLWLSDLSEFTLLPGVPYWVGVNLSSVTSAGAFALQDFSFTSNNNTYYNHLVNNTYQRLNSASGTTCTLERNYAVPFFHNSATGFTTYLTKHPAITEETSRTIIGNLARAREFGFKFEYNILPLQDYDVRSITLSFLRPSVNDVEYCMRVYDGTNFDNLVGTGITLKGYDVGAIGATNASAVEWEFIFEPPLKLRSNKSYYAGVAWTYPTIQPVTSEFNFIGISNLFGINSDQSSVLSYRSNVGTGALTDYPPQKIPLNMYIIRTNKANRSIGN